MEKLKEALTAQGVARETLDKMDEAQIRGLAKAFSLDPHAFLPRKVKIETGANGAQYVVTEGYSVPKFQNKKAVDGQSSLARNLYVRAEAIDQIIEDLLVAKGLLGK